MKKSIFMLALIAGSLFVSCKNNEEKKADAVDGVVEASKDLNDVNAEIKNEALTKANDQEWQTYKMEANKTIAENETRILELQKAINKPGNTFDATYKKSINDLNDRNTSLKNRIADYENNQTDWESFKREFNSDMDGIGKALKNITVNNKK